MDHSIVTQESWAEQRWRMETEGGFRTVLVDGNCAFSTYQSVFDEGDGTDCPLCSAQEK